MNQMRCCHDAKKVKVKVVGLLTALPMAQLFFPIIDNIDSIAFQKNSLRQGTDFPDKWTLINHLWLSQLFDFVYKVIIKSKSFIPKYWCSFRSPTWPYLWMPPNTLITGGTFRVSFSCGLYKWFSWLLLLITSHLGHVFGHSKSIIAFLTWCYNRVVHSWPFFNHSSIIFHLILFPFFSKLKLRMKEKLIQNGTLILLLQK